MMKATPYLILMASLSSCLNSEQDPQNLHQGNLSDSHQSLLIDTVEVEVEEPVFGNTYSDISDTEFQDILALLPIKDTSGFYFYNKKYLTKKDSFWVIQAITTPDSFTYHFDIYLLQKRAGNYQISLSIDTEKERIMNARVYDTIMDVNFDGLEDYMTSHYSGTGCCPRDSRNVYLNKGDHFSSKDVHLFNPGFDTVNKTIQEMGYGHPPYVSLYKSKWVGDSLQLMETISHNMTYDDTILRYKPGGMYHVSYGNDDSSTLIQEIPPEYNSVYDFFWFVDSIAERSNW